MAAQASPKSAIFRENFDYLVNSVQMDLNRIARRAYAKGLIGGDTFDSVRNQTKNGSDRASELISAVQRRIEVSEETFDVFIAILREEPVVSGVADSLEQAARPRGRPRGGGGVDGGSASDRVLTKENLPQLVELLADIAAQWDQLGLQLEVSKGKLNSIEVDCRGAQRCLTEMLSSWLSGSERPTVGKLTSALKSRPVNEVRLAEEVMRKYSS